MAATGVTQSNERGVYSSGSFTLNLAELASATQGTDTAAIPEARVGDIAIVTPRGALTEGLEIKHSYVSANGTVTIVLHNHTGEAIDEGSTVFDYLIVRGNTGFMF